MGDGNKNQTKHFEESLTAYRNRIFAWVLVRVGSDRTVAEDVTQECLVRVWATRVHNPPPSGALYTYLLITARNLLRDRFRRQVTTLLTNGEENIIPDRQTPEDQFVLRETVERLATATALMPHLLRETLRLRVEEELDYPTIATRMGCPKGTVKSRLNAARTYLRAVLEQAEKIEVPDTNHAYQRHSVTSIYRNMTIYKEETTMTTSTEISELRTRIQAMEERLRVLEYAVTETTGEADPWTLSTKRFAESLKQGRQNRTSAFALGLVHMITQSADRSPTGTALGIRTFESAADLPDDRTLEERRERMRLLISDPALLRIFRHFFALRFGNKDMRATAQELAEATGESIDKVQNLLKPLLADRTLFLVRTNDTVETYEWEGNDSAITTLLFATT